MTVWRHTDRPEAGYATLLSKAMGIVEESDGELLWPIDESPQVIVSDYPGQHRQATHGVY